MEQYKIWRTKNYNYHLEGAQRFQGDDPSATWKIYSKHLKDEQATGEIAHDLEPSQTPTI